MMVKSGLENFLLKFLHAPKLFSLIHKIAQNYKFSNKKSEFTSILDGFLLSV